MTDIPEIVKKYDVAFSFAGAQREYVKKVKEALVKYSVSVFYDNDHIEELWGKNLYRYLDQVYSENAVYCVIFISREYKERAWTIHESQSAQERAFSNYDSENFQEYILPVRFDETDIPGIRRTTGYIDAREVGPEELAYLIAKKLHKVVDIPVAYKKISEAYEALIQMLQNKLNKFKQLIFHSEKDYLHVDVIQAEREETIAVFRRINDCIQIYWDDDILENPGVTIFMDNDNSSLPFRVLNHFSLSFEFVEKNLTLFQLSEFLCTELENSLR